MVHFKKVCGCEKGGLFEARIFKEGSYENRDKWHASFNVHIQGEKAYISLLDRGWDRKTHTETEDFCRSKGAKFVNWERRGKLVQHRL